MDNVYGILLNQNVYYFQIVQFQQINHIVLNLIHFVIGIKIQQNV